VSRQLFFGVLVVALCVALGGQAGVSQAQSEAQQLLALVNQARANAGVGPLALSCPLNVAAERHLQDMKANNFFDHAGSDGSNAGERADDAGYDGRGWAENIAGGHRSAQSVFDAWIGSDGHRRNILNGNYQHMGLAYDPQSRLWVQTFGGRGNTACPSFDYDVDNDGRHNPADAVMAINRLGSNDADADVNGDGQVTAVDVELILGELGGP